uniref:ODAD1 central coiled coil region domain-containing protein n=1 Tax=Timema genevievae TaxID=629358 RepID=A0A7R9K161_TIMGE|nr:unnamed protein product [Timema genevievae]
MDMAQMYLKRQRKMIEFLKAENEDLLTSARVAGSKGKEAAAAETKAVIKDRLAHMEQYKSKIKIERTQLKELQTQIMKLEKELNRVKVKNKISEHATLARAVEYEQLLNRLKCRLEVGHDKFGVMLAENKSLRHEITFLLQERHNFNAVYSSLVTLYTKGGEKDLKQLIWDFQKKEESNFSLYTNVVILNEEVQKIEHSIQCLNNDTETCWKKIRQEKQCHREKLFDLKVLLEESRSITNKANEKKAWCEQKMETLMKGLETIFALLDGDRGQMLEKLGDNTHVSLSNVEMHLIAIEFRINELLNVLSYLQEKESLTGLALYRLYYPLEDENNQIYNRLEQWKEEIKQMAVTTPCALCVEQQELVKEGNKCDGRLQRPLVKEELELDLKERANRLETILHNVSVCLLPKSRQIVEKRMN